MKFDRIIEIWKVLRNNKVWKIHKIVEIIESSRNFLKFLEILDKLSKIDEKSRKKFFEVVKIIKNFEISTTCKIFWHFFQKTVEIFKKIKKNWKFSNIFFFQCLQQKNHQKIALNFQMSILWNLNSFNDR